MEQSSKSEKHTDGITLKFTFLYRVFSLTWPASTQIYYNKRKRLHKKGVQLPEDWERHQYGRRDVMWKHYIVG